MGRRLGQAPLRDPTSTGGAKPGGAEPRVDVGTRQSLTQRLFRARLHVRDRNLLALVVDDFMRRREHRAPSARTAVDPGMPTPSGPFLPSYSRPIPRSHS